MAHLRHALVAFVLLLPGPGQAETKEEWIILGARVHGGFGPFIPVGIRIGMDALERLKAPRHEVVVTYYDAGLPPCPCIADGIMIATQATPAQKMMTFSTETPPEEFMAVIVIRNRKTNDAVRYTIAKDWHARILAWRQLDPSARYDAAMSVEGLFEVDPVK